MPTVGVRELKNRLSFYLKRVMGGERIEVTHRGKVIALLIPARTNKTPQELLMLAEEGLASWGGGKPSGSSKPVKIRGQPLSELVLADRG
jgi:prevent-host-death family protein